MPMTSERRLISLFKRSNGFVECSRGDSYNDALAETTIGLFKNEWIQTETSLDNTRGGGDRTIEWIRLVVQPPAS
jgi:hypothetical protein